MVYTKAWIVYVCMSIYVGSETFVSLTLLCWCKSLLLVQSVCIDGRRRLYNLQPVVVIIVELCGIFDDVVGLLSRRVLYGFPNRERWYCGLLGAACDIPF